MTSSETERFKLEPHEAAGPLWATKFKPHFEKRLATLRMANDRSDLSETETAKIRGQIAEVKAMLSADKPDRVVT